MPSPIARPAKRINPLTKRKKANALTSLKAMNTLTSEIDQPAYPSDGHLSLSGSVAELKHKISA